MLPVLFAALAVWTICSAAGSAAGLALARLVPAARQTEAARGPYRDECMARQPTLVNDRKRSTQAAAAPLIVRMHTGERVAVRVDALDRTAWILPKKQLAAFARSGVIITERRRMKSDAEATVTAVSDGVASLRGSATVIDSDLARHTTGTASARVMTSLTSRNEEVSARLVPLEGAPMARFPSWPVKLGSRWLTYQRVTTRLGSGHITILHTVTAFDGRHARIAVCGHGEITGAEYKLPRLLPGTIALQGVALFDMHRHVVVLEDYAVHNRLEKPARGEFIGFDETETVETITSAEGW